jgi:mannose-1-phosphate guanylyltransferase
MAIFDPSALALPHPWSREHPEPEPPRTFWSVIPAGGAGTRLWPVSRSGQPKFLLRLVKPQRSLLQDTVDRLRLVGQPEQVLVVCGPAHAPAITRQLPELAPQQILVEPTPKGTGPAIALAAALIAREDPRAIMGSFAADHDVRRRDTFAAAVDSARAAAAEGWLVTIGIQPTRPETGYGYIERDATPVLTTSALPVHRALRFVEKPDLERATTWVKSGRFLWNASMFVWRVDVFLTELRRHLPDVAAGVERIADAWGTDRQDAELGAIWPTLPDVTIDTGIMERSDRVAVVPADMGWSDVGDWHGLGALLDRDEAGNSIRGDTISASCTDSVVWSETDRVISLVGLNNVIVVDTPDALLVADRAHAQLVRTTVDRLKALNRINLV